MIACNKITDSKSIMKKPNRLRGWGGKPLVLKKPHGPGQKNNTPIKNNLTKLSDFLRRYVLRS